MVSDARGTRFTFDIAGQRQVDRQLSRFGENVRDLRPFYQDTVREFSAIAEDQFNTEGGRAQKWEPLNPAYAAFKARMFPATGILHATGRLRASIVAGNTSESVKDIRPQSLRWGTTVPYAVKHQTGDGVPERRIIDLTREDRQDVLRRLQRYLVTQERVGAIV